MLDKICASSGVSAVVLNYYGRLWDKITFDFMLNEEPEPAMRRYLESKGSSIFMMPGLQIAKLPSYVAALKKFYEHNHYHIVHGHVPSSAAFYLGLAKNVPHRIIHSHSTKSSGVMWKRARNWLPNRLIKFVANKQMACSMQAAEYLFGKKNDAFILNNAIEIDKFLFNESSRARVRAELGLSEEKVIGHIGRFCKEKNQGFIIEAFNEAYKIDKKVRLMPIGDGPLREKAIAKVNNLGISQAVMFIGVVDDVSSYLSAMDLFVLPSKFEGLGLAAVEAQASGLPVIVSDVVPKIVSISGGVEFIGLDRSKWAKKLLDTPASISDRSKEGNKLKKGMYDIETQAKELFMYYQGLHAI